MALGELVERFAHFSYNRYVEYNEISEELDEVIGHYRNKWKLEAIKHESFEDFAQNTRLHIYKKLHLYNPKKSPFGAWANRIVHNQLFNTKRKLWNKANKPCTNCEFARWDGCAWTKSGQQDSTCAKFKKWEKTHQDLRLIQTATSIQDRDRKDATPIMAVAPKELDWESLIPEFHAQWDKAMKEALENEDINQSQYQIFAYIHLQKMSEDDTALAMGYKSNEEGRAPGYRAIGAAQKAAKEIGKRVIEGMDWVD